MNVRPLHDQIFLKPNLDPEKSPGGIFIPDTARSKLGEGIVVAVGPGKVLDCGKFRETEVKVGQKVLYQKYTGTNVTVNEEDLLVVHEFGEVLGVYES